MESEQSDALPSQSEPVAVSGAAELEELLDEYPIVLIDFMAEWCGPCKIMEPILEDLAEETALTVGRVDVDESQQLAAEHNVRGVPTMELYHNGDVTDRFVGVTDGDELREKIQQLAN